MSAMLPEERMSLCVAIEPELHAAALLPVHVGSGIPVPQLQDAASLGKGLRKWGLSE